MKKIVVVLVSFVVAVLIGVGNTFAQDKASKASIPNPSLGPEWKLVAKGYDNGITYYVDTRRITHLPGGIVKVWELWVPRGKDRREAVNALKHDLLSEGKNPNKAKRFGYFIFLVKFNCKNYQDALLEYIAYSFGGVDLNDYYYQREEWEDIPPGSTGEEIEKYVCKKYK